MKKKIIKSALILLSSIMIATFLSPGCGKKEQSAKPGSAATGRLSIVCTVFPQYDWTRQILGDLANGVDLTLLLDNRVDLHNYQPTVQDIAKISTADLFIYVGGESDEWIGKVLSSASNPNIVALNLLDALGDAAKLEEVVEGMQEVKHEHDDDDDDEEDGRDHARDNRRDDKHRHDHKSGHGHKDSAREATATTKNHGDGDGHEHAHRDEHVWLSLRNAQTLAAAIAGALSSLDGGNAAGYQANLAAYVEKLSELDREYQAAVSAVPVKTLLFGDRFPFRYLMDDYGLKYYAAFTGCSAETEASFETIAFLARKADELKLRNVMVTESADQSIARTVISSTRGKDQRILVLNSMQSVTSGDVRDGAEYLSIMRGNLDVLREALK